MVDGAQTGGHWLTAPDGVFPAGPSGWRRRERCAPIVTWCYTRLVGLAQAAEFRSGSCLRGFDRQGAELAELRADHRPVGVVQVIEYVLPRREGGRAGGTGPGLAGRIPGPAGRRQAGRGT